MRLKIKKENLVGIINTVSKALPTRTTLPILDGILIETRKKDNSIKLFASDTTISIIKEGVCEEVIEEGEVVVAAKLFCEIVKKLPSGIITISLKENKVIVQSGKSRLSVPTFKASEFPEFKTGETSSICNIKKDILQKTIKFTTSAASIDASRGILCGVYMQVEDNVLSLTATDGFRLANCKEKITSEMKEKSLISSKTLDDVAKILTETSSDDILVGFSENYQEFKTDDTDILVRQISGQYIDYNKIINIENPNIYKLNKVDFQEALSRASILASGKNQALKLTFTQNNVNILVSNEEGIIEEDICTTSTNEKDIKIGFNAKYLLEAIKSISEEDIEVFLDTSNKPAFIRGSENKDYLYLVLPVIVH